MGSCSRAVQRLLLNSSGVVARHWGPGGLQELGLVVLCFVFSLFVVVASLLSFLFSLP